MAVPASNEPKGEAFVVPVNAGDEWGVLSIEINASGHPIRINLPRQSIGDKQDVDLSGVELPKEVLQLSDSLVEYFAYDPRSKAHTVKVATIVDWLDSAGITSPFMKRALVALYETEPGETISYSDLARRAGNPRAFRAAASACRRNPFPILIPCHRVLPVEGIEWWRRGAPDEEMSRFVGRYAGDAYGATYKIRLLNHEKRAENRSQV